MHPRTSISRIYVFVFSFSLLFSFSSLIQISLGLAQTREFPPCSQSEVEELGVVEDKWSEQSKGRLHLTYYKEGPSYFQCISFVTEEVRESRD